MGNGKKKASRTERNRGLESSYWSTERVGQLVSATRWEEGRGGPPQGWTGGGPAHRWCGQGWQKGLPGSCSVGRGDVLRQTGRKEGRLFPSSAAEAPCLSPKTHDLVVGRIDWRQQLLSQMSPEERISS